MCWAKAFGWACSKGEALECLEEDFEGDARVDELIGVVYVVSGA
jgi:hypothetical protein